MPTLPPRKPERAPVWDPNTSRYWDPRDLEDELRRTFQICSDCRMCVTYCGSFPLLFEAVDREVDAGSVEGVETLSAETFQEVADHCWQCKLCYIKCPYTPDEGAPELLDFPRLMARERAQRARRDGVPLVDRVLGEPQLVGAVSSGPLAPFVTLVNEKRLVRKIQERVTGISAEFPLPPFASQTFTNWFATHEPLPGAGRAGEVVLFATCYGQYNFPEVPRAAVEVLEKNELSVQVVPELTCCGMPNLDGGDVAAAQRKMQANVDLLLPHVKQGRRIVVIGPTCGYTIKKEWPLYLGSNAAAQVSDNTLDLMELLDKLRLGRKLSTDFENSLGKVAYHAACHLRAQKIAIPGARVLSRVPETEVRIIERCSAVDGTWGMKARFYEEGARYGRRLTHAVQSGREQGERLVVTDCSLAGLRILKENAKRALHPVQALAYAYGLSAGADVPDAWGEDAREERAGEAD